MRDLTLSAVRSVGEMNEELERLSNVADACLIIDGDSLALCLGHCLQPFLGLATRLPAVVCCRCAPTQKSQVADAIKQFTNQRVCCIGDGGNDVAMFVR